MNRVKMGMEAEPIQPAAFKKQDVSEDVPFASSHCENATGETNFPSSNSLERKKTTITDLPHELISMIMTIFLEGWYYKVPDLVSPVCLGLTARVFYFILKTLLPAPINLCTMVSPPCGSIRIDKLAEHLNHGRSTYRICQRAVDGPWLLRRKIYGDKWGPKEDQLWWRYEWYSLMTVVEGNSVKTRMLPNPYNMGEEWYYTVHTILQNGLQPQWSVAETDFWHRRQLSKHFGRMKRFVRKFVENNPRNHNLVAS